MQYLYLISCKSGFETFYKVGISNDVESRLAQLQTGNPLELSIEACYGFDNAEIVEKSIHQAWEKEKIRGEWFNVSGCEDKFHDICELMNGAVFVPDNYETTEASIEEAEHDYVLTSGVDWRLEARTDRHPAGFVIMKRGMPKEYLGYIRGCDLLDSKRPTIEEVEKFLSDTVGSGLVEAK
jgi:hypothetical protein